MRRKLRGVPRPRRRTIGEKLSRVQDNFCRYAARRIVDDCTRDNVGVLRVEDLKGIREAADQDTERNFYLGTWPFFKFQQYLAQYCTRLGIELKWVPAAKTSITCSRCGAVDKEARRGRRFECALCGLRADADLNAANNIAGVAVTVLALPRGGIPSAAPDSPGEAPRRLFDDAGA